MRCGQRFSNKPLKSAGAIPISRQICAKEAKNLHVLKAKSIGTVEETPETRAALKVFEAWMQKKDTNRIENTLEIC